MKKSRATGYLVKQFTAYSDDPESYEYAKTRVEVESKLVDCGWLDNPGVMVYLLFGKYNVRDEQIALSQNDDPYPDYIVEYGPRSGIRWERC